MKKEGQKKCVCCSVDEIQRRGRKNVFKMLKTKIILKSLLL